MIFRNDKHTQKGAETAYLSEKQDFRSSATNWDKKRENQDSNCAQVALSFDFNDMHLRILPL